MNGDNFGVCFIKIGHMVSELCMWKVSFNENAVQNIGIIFFQNMYCVCGTVFISMRILILLECMVCNSRSTVCRQIGSTEFESGECDVLECAYMWVCGQKQIYSHQNEY